MQQSGLSGFAKTVLTIVGIVLLIVFGARAASQAGKLTANQEPSAKRGGVPIINTRQLAILSKGSFEQMDNMTTQQLLAARPYSFSQRTMHQPVKTDVAKSAKKSLVATSKIQRATGFAIQSTAQIRQPAKQPSVK